MPILKMLQQIPNRADVLDEVLIPEGGSVCGYNSYRDGTLYRESEFFIPSKLCLVFVLMS